MASWSIAAIALLAVALVGVTEAASVTKTKCPVVPGKSPFDFNKFRGDWLVVAGSPDSVASSGRCGKYSVSAGPGSDAFSMRFSGSGPSVDVFTQAVAGDKLALGHTIYRKQGTSEYDGVFKQSIVATDYDNYAVVIACRQVYVASTKSFGRHLIAEIWSRNKVTLTPETQALLKNVVSSYDIDAADVKTLDRSKC